MEFMAEGTERAAAVAGETDRARCKEKQMKRVIGASRRRFLKRVTLGFALMPVARVPFRIAVAADLPLVTSDDPTALALKYVSDASKSSDAKPGNKCANCAFYQGATGSAQAGRPLFPGKSVKATGWCSSWNAKG
jgi:hypothetical protein